MKQQKKLSRSIMTIYKCIKKIVKSYYLFIINIPAWALIIFFSLSIAICGILTSPRFNDGIVHLNRTKEWFSIGHRPILMQYADSQSFLEESPLWYWFVQTLYKITGEINYITAQFFQTLCYFCMLTAVYFFAKKHCGNTFKTKTAVILCATIPMLTVPTVLCFLDVLCAFFVTLSFYLLCRKKFLLAAISAAGIWYSKRSGFIVLPAFFIAWGVIIIFENRKELLYAAREITIGVFVFITLISWDIWFRIKYLNIANALLLTSKKNLAIQHSPSASSMKLFDWLQWTGGTLPLLFAFFILFLITGKTDRKNFIKQNWAYLLLFVIFSALYLAFSPGYTIRYYAIICPLIITMLISALPTKHMQGFWLILITGAFLQFTVVMHYIYNNRQISSEAKNVLSFLETQPVKEKIVWFEKEFGYHSLGRKIYWETYLQEILNNNIDNLLKENVKTIVITKRFSYKYNGNFYDRGLPYFVIKKISHNERLKKVIDNKMYSVYKVINFNE